MARFAYTVLDDNDRELSGTVSGSTVEEVYERLAQNEYADISVVELGFDGQPKGVGFAEKLAAGWSRMQNHVPQKAVVFFTRQLATMLEAGVPISEALLQLAEGEQPVFRKMILQIEEDISAGRSFSDALAAHPGAFSSMFVSVIRSGEASGALVKVLDQMATYMESSEMLRQKIKGALRYPMFIGGFVVIMMIGILWKLVPVFASMYQSFDAQLPLLTRVLIALSQFVQDYFPLVVAGFVGIGLLFKASLTNAAVQFFIHANVLRLPVYGIILRKNIWARFCRTLALLMKSGTPILQAVEISAGVVNNTLFASRLEDVFEKLRNGEPLSKSLRETTLFPRLITQLTATGEKSGRIDELLVKAAEFYEREIRITVDSLSSIIEPLLIIVLGGVIGAVVIALYLPIFSMGQLFH